MKCKTILTWALLVFAGALLVSCGRKTAPIPPQAIIPPPVSDLSYRLDEKGVTLSWSPATRTEQGGRLPASVRSLVERAVYDIDDFCENCPILYNEVSSIAGDGPGGQDKQKRTYREERLRPGHVYFYRVKTGIGWGVASHPSEPISFRWQRPMAPPVALSGTAGDRQISLNWQPPVGALNGESVDASLLYQVYRRGASGSLMPLGRPAAGLDFTDQQVENGEIYQYKVRAIRASGGSGVLSDKLEISPRDMTPPLPPQGLSIVAMPGGVRLFWEPVADSDLGGYQVLRRPGDSESVKDFRVVGRVAAGVNSFVDKTLKDQATCYYSLKAFDLAIPANESPLSDEIKMKRNR